MPRSSQRRGQILEFIREFLGSKGYAPTVREIMQGCHINSIASVQHHLNVLEEEGFFQRDPDVARSIRLAKGTGPEGTELPLLGTIAAGEPIPVPGSENWTTVPEEMFSIPQGLVGSSKQVYALRVKGTSMVDALIDDGDVVVMEPARTAEDGEVVAVWLRSEQEVTLKRIYRERDRVRLQPANPLMPPIFADPEDVEIQGKLLAVVRKFGR